MLGLLAGSMNGNGDKDKPEESYYIPLMVLNGPFVREDMMPLSADVKTGADGRKVIAITQIPENDEAGRICDDIK
jgi:hypothetical protein